MADWFGHFITNNLKATKVCSLHSSLLRPILPIVSLSPLLIFSSSSSTAHLVFARARPRRTSDTATCEPPYRPSFNVRPFLNSLPSVPPPLLLSSLRSSSPPLFFSSFFFFSSGSADVGGFTHSDVSVYPSQHWTGLQVQNSNTTFT